MSEKYFHIIAGPNGSGKSTNSKHLVLGIPVYDADIELANIRHNLPSYASEEVVNSLLFKVFQEVKNRALATGKSFAMETNFATSLGDWKELLYEFRNNNYLINLYYFGLTSIEASNFRVAQRVAKGGHSVSLDSIRYNYEQGILNLNACIALMDNVFFLDNSKTKLTEIATIQAEEKHILVQTPPRWFNINFANLFK